jgi:hypothetical protein
MDCLGMSAHAKVNLIPGWLILTASQRTKYLEVFRVFFSGILVEHWDVIQDEATEEQSKSGNPMFGNHFPTYQ